MRRRRGIRGAGFAVPVRHRSTQPSVIHLLRRKQGKQAKREGRQAWSVRFTTGAEKMAMSWRHNRYNIESYQDVIMKSTSSSPIRPPSPFIVMAGMAMNPPISMTGRASTSILGIQIRASGIAIFHRDHRRVYNAIAFSKHLRDLLIQALYIFSTNEKAC